MKGTSVNRVNSVLIMFVLIGVVLYYAQNILILVTFAILLSMLMVPLSNKIEAKGISRFTSSLISVLVVILIMFAILGLVYLQVLNILEDLPLIQQKIEMHLQNLQGFIQENFKLERQQQIGLLKDQAQNWIKAIGLILKNVIAGFARILIGLFVVLIFLFLLLYNRSKYEQFFLTVFSGNRPEELQKLLQAISRVAQQYLTGRVLSIIILTFLYSAGLMIIGVKNAFLLAFVAALLTFIPYIGPVIGGLFPFTMALITEDTIFPALGVVAVIAVVQLVDDYFIEPYVVGGEVNISPFFTIVVLIAGGYLWGIAGLILFLPMLGIAKIIFDHVDPLKPYGILIGESSNKSWKNIFNFFKRNKNN